MNVIEEIREALNYSGDCPMNGYQAAVAIYCARLEEGSMCFYERTVAVNLIENAAKIVHFS